MLDDPEDPFLTVDEAASFLRMSKRTLANHRSQKTGPECRRHGGRIVYRRSALLAWSRKGIIPTGSEKGAHTHT
jgi:predicted DNA-binding transcriptional regulator AlpA